MKKNIVIGIILGSFLFSCNKNCPNIENETCQDQPPSSEVTCLASFETWFYNEDSNKCELKGYSGCHALGFATEQVCHSCKCIE